ncbi:hypothetical protein F4212_04810 [Candidatus Poribacteria bacterium]|nr:hypothetical protein [Candidatus Poribacteria bacterium]
MANTTEISSELLIRVAQADAQRDVSKWCWMVFGMCLSILPVINVVLLVIAILIVNLLIPKIDFSLPERVGIYSQHPALYTDRYRKTAKRLRSMHILCGWTIGIIIIIFF